MIEYRVICETLDAQITIAVNEAIAEGWEPLGGILVVVVDQYFNKRYFQAMTRDKTKNSKRISKRQRIMREMADGVDEALIVAEEN